MEQAKPDSAITLLSITVGVLYALFSVFCFFIASWWLNTEGDCAFSLGTWLLWLAILTSAGIFLACFGSILQHTTKKSGCLAGTSDLCIAFAYLGICGHAVCAFIGLGLVIQRSEDVDCPGAVWYTATAIAGLFAGVIVLVLGCVTKDLLSYLRSYLFGFPQVQALQRV